MRFEIDAESTDPVNDTVHFGRDLDAAERALETIVEDGIGRMLTGRAVAGERLLLDATMGLGKSWRVMRALARQLRPGQVAWIALPTLAMADEAAAMLDQACRALGRSDLTQFVWRGRGARDPANPDATMCDRSALAGRIAQIAGNVDKRLCRPTDGPACPRATICSYLRQQHDAGAVATLGGVLFINHAHLWMPDALPSPDLVIIDESLLLSAVDVTGMPMESLRYARDEAGQGALHRVLDRLIVALEQAPGHEIERLLAGGAPALADDLDKAIALAEATAMRAMPKLDPSDNDDALTARLDAKVAGEVGEWRTVARLLRQVRIELPRQRPGFNGIVYQPRDPMRIRSRDARLDYVEISGLRTLGLAARTPVLALDGTACVTLWRRLLGETLDLYRVRVTRNAQVVQVSRKTFSSRSLIGDLNGTLQGHWAKDARALRRILLTFLNAHDQARLFLCGCKTVIDALESSGLPAHVETAHYNAQRGRNFWQACGIAVILGRLQPPIVEVEKLARAYAAFDDAPFASSTIYSTQARAVTMRTGDIRHEVIPAHDDRFANAVLQLIREAEIEQSIDRVRAARQARLIILLTNVPVEIEVDEHLLWPALHRREMTFRMLFNRHGLLPLRPEHLHCLDALWPSAGAAGRAVQRGAGGKCDDAQIISSLLGVCRLSTLPRVIDYVIEDTSGRRPGRSSKLIVDLERHPDPAAALTLLLRQHGLLEAGQSVVCRTLGRGKGILAAERLAEYRAFRAELDAAAAGAGLTVEDRNGLFVLTTLDGEELPRGYYRPQVMDAIAAYRARLKAAA